MMPLTLANMGEENLIHRVGGSPEVKKHLEDLGFVAGDTVTVVSSLAETSSSRSRRPASPSARKWPERS